MIVSVLMLVATIGVTYWYWIRPILKTRPKLAVFYSQEATFFAAIRQKLNGLKQELSAAFVVAAGAFVSLHDQIAPYLTGVDVTQFASFVPTWAWPIIMMSLMGLVTYLRGSVLGKSDD